MWTFFWHVSGFICLQAGLCNVWLSAHHHTHDMPLVEKQNRPYSTSSRTAGIAGLLREEIWPTPASIQGQRILQDCRSHRLLREEIWPTPAPLQEKLHGPVDALQKTTDFISRVAVQVCDAGERKNHTHLEKNAALHHVSGLPAKRMRLTSQ